MNGLNCFSLMVKCIKISNFEYQPISIIAKVGRPLDGQVQHLQRFSQPQIGCSVVTTNW